MLSITTLRIKYQVTVKLITYQITFNQSVQTNCIQEPLLTGTEHHRSFTGESVISYLVYKIVQKTYLIMNKTENSNRLMMSSFYGHLATKGQEY